MATENLSFNVEPRTSGKHFSRELRNEMKVPGVVYGPKTKSSNLWLLEKDLKKFMSHQFENSIFTLQSPENSLNNLKVLKKAVAIHPVSRRPVHIDFFAIDMTQAIRVDVEVRFIGKAEGTKGGGVMNLVQRTVEVECLPSDIPAFIEVDVTKLIVGDSLHVSDLTAPNKVKIVSRPQETLCTISIVEEIVAAPVVAAPVEGAAAEGADAEGADAKAAEGDAKAKADDKKAKDE
jgi:large subunit ribosomal protein L25